MFELSNYCLRRRFFVIQLRFLFCSMSVVFLAGFLHWSYHAVCLLIVFAELFRCYRISISMLAWSQNFFQLYFDWCNDLHDFSLFVQIYFKQTSFEFINVSDQVWDFDFQYYLKQNYSLAFLSFFTELYFLSYHCILLLIL